MSLQRLSVATVTRALIGLILLSGWLVPVAQADGCTTDVLTLSGSSDAATVCLANATRNGDGSVTADVVITNKKVIMYALSFQRTGSVTKMANGQEFFGLLDQLARSHNWKSQFLPVAGNSTMTLAQVNFPPGSQLTMTFRKFGDDSGQGISLLALDLGAMLGKIQGGVDVGKQLSGNPTAADDFATKLLGSLGNAGFDLAAATAQLGKGDWLGALDSMVDAIKQSPDAFSGLLGLSSDALRSGLADLGNLLKAFDVLPYAADLAGAPTVATFQIGNGAQTPAQPSCSFTLGFATLAALIPDQVGTCTDNESHNPDNGDALQHTTKGLLVWRKADNWTAFTDGYRTWINGPNGLVSRLNTERCTWEGGLTVCGSGQGSTTAPTPSAPVSLFISTGYERGALYAPPNYPDKIGLNNHNSISDLVWSGGGTAEAVATGIVHEDTCIPDCASGSYRNYPVKITASQPANCNITVYQPYSDLSQKTSAFVYTRFDFNPSIERVGFGGTCAVSR